MEWYNKLAAFSLDSSGSSDLEEFSKDPDRNLLMLMVEKVLLVKITGIVEASYDPLSSAQTLKLTGLLSRYQRIVHCNFQTVMMFQISFIQIH